MKKTLNIQVRGEDEGDLVMALEVITGQIDHGFISGVDCNETGSYQYVINKEDEVRTCLVKGCENKTTEGFFEGKICTSCYEMLVSGNVGSGETFIHKLIK